SDRLLWDGPGGGQRGTRADRDRRGVGALFAAAGPYDAGQTQRRGVMDVILLERIERLGQMGDVVNVRPGFARNFLFPQKKALRANKDNKTYFESKRAELEATNI